VVVGVNDGVNEYDPVIVNELVFVGVSVGVGVTEWEGVCVSVLDTVRVSVGECDGLEVGVTVGVGLND
jgi:hypothetical protein